MRRLRIAVGALTLAAGMAVLPSGVQASVIKLLSHGKVVATLDLHELAAKDLHLAFTRATMTSGHGIVTVHCSGNVHITAGGNHQPFMQITADEAEMEMPASREPSKK